jgi:hypothetical protein
MSFWTTIKGILFPKYVYLSNRNIRVDIYDGVAYGFSCELGKWKELEYLEGSNYDAGQWSNIPSYIRHEILLTQKGLCCGNKN